MAASPRNLAVVRAWRNGFTVAEMDAYLEEWGHECGICRRPYDPAKRQGGLVIDHDHDCCDHDGKRCGTCVRGVLCVPCNAAIGQFGDDPDRLRAAIEYLGRPRVKPAADRVLKARLAVRSGVLSNAAKFTADQVRDVRSRHASGQSASSLAREFRVKHETITNMIRRRTYAHVD